MGQNLTWLLGLDPRHCLQIDLMGRLKEFEGAVKEEINPSFHSVQTFVH
jgi:hypothetical protein